MRVTHGCAALLVSSSLYWLPAPASVAEDDQTRDCSEIATEDAGHYSTDHPSLPLQEMGVDDAWARLEHQHVRPGQGVTVAVIDSGVAKDAPITLAGQPVDAGNKLPEPQDYHGTAVAGLIAGHVRPGGGGPVGIAPWAKIFDVQVYDEAGASTAPDSTESPMTVENLRAGLDAVIAAAPRLGITIVNMSLAIPDDDQIRAKI
ncbi:MAG TPA: S8 family serine peptidase, partial [Nocardioides sp.]|nr:S8 family serine peptidase [Nocardioides sp.]